MPLKVNKVTIIPAPIIPNKIKKLAFLIGMPKRKAAKAPVQAPVIGKGMATKTKRAISPYNSNFLECLRCVRLKSQKKNL